ncbi:MAG: hydrogenase formation protein HypD [Planctomycetes bacterium GWF2_50_10]|nr:MAG: hydrogenase formation protein HypD [Planctomycetes bacterium GWF2_50_10]
MLQRIWKAHNLMDLACKDLPCSLNIMEVCGTHTVSIFRNGIRPTLPANLRLLSGPGCPVCVTDQGYIENVLTLAGRDDIIIATYGDMIRVPSKNGSLEKRADNQNVKIVLSSMEALDIAKQNPSKTVVFVAVGFETTTPATAIAVRYAAAENIKNFCILSAHKTVVPAMEALLSSEKAKIDAFICPGHVSVIIGSDAYNPIVTKYKKPCVVAGFEPMQIIEGIAQICSQVAAHAPKVESMYHAVVTPQGNVKAKAIIDEMFEPADGVWRGIGVIKNSALVLRDKFSEFDAAKRFGLSDGHPEDMPGCHCGEVLCGLIDPPQCKLFATTCNPDNPIGPCMVSSEGACSAWFKYGRRKKRENKQ